MNVFMTGVTGLLGSSLLVKLVRSSDVSSITVMLRPKGAQTVDQRFKDLVEGAFAPQERPLAQSKLRFVAGDLLEPSLGLGVRDRWQILDRVDAIIHLASDDSLSSGIENSRQVNVDGTAKVLELAEACHRTGNLKQYIHLSTAFVSGNHEGDYSEDDFDLGQGFSNVFEQSKFEGEKLVRARTLGVPIKIVRPSVIVGRSDSGYTLSFKAIYWPLKVLSKKIIPFLPLNPKAKLDLVPVDYVSDCLFSLLYHEVKGTGTYHVTCGKGNEIALGKILKDAYKHGIVAKTPRMPIWLFSLVRNSFVNKFFNDEVWDAFALAESYQKYLEGNLTTFESRKSRALFEDKGVILPKWKDYSRRIFQYCLISHWGKINPKPSYQFFR